LENERRSKSSDQGKWLMRLSVSEGGIQLHGQEFPFMAPEAGYRPSIELGLHSVKPPAWGSSEMGGTVFLSMQGLYARAELRMFRGGSLLRLSYYLNPSGSRNLEPDPSLLFRDLDSYNAYMTKQKQASK